MASVRITILGSGTSHGIPMIGCDCAVCTSADLHDRRSRTSALVETQGRSYLIDTAPELRLQALARDITRVDAVLYTHHHADHIVGLDDLRRFNALKGGSLTCYGNAKTVSALESMFPYAFQDRPGYPSSKPDLNLQVIDGPFAPFDVQITPIPLMHGPLPVLGFRFGRFAYCTDVSEIPAASFDLLANLDVLVLDGLRRRPHATHFNLDQAVAAAQRIGAKQTFLTHIAHELGHARTNAELPDNIQLAYDGQIIETGE